MVGVNGAKISNLNPPTLAVVTFGIAQVGLALLLRPLLARWMQRPVAWAAVAMANLSAMTLFLWHQTAFLTVNMTTLAFGRLAGLHNAPTSPLWIVERLAWLPVFAATLAVLWTLFARFERAPRTRTRRPRPVPGDQSPGARPAQSGPRPVPGDQSSGVRPAQSSGRKETAMATYPQALPR
jgi:hypothetical protein